MWYDGCVSYIWFDVDICAVRGDPALLYRGEVCSPSLSQEEQPTLLDTLFGLFSISTPCHVSNQFQAICGFSICLADSLRRFVCFLSCYFLLGACYCLGLDFAWRFYGLEFCLMYQSKHRSKIADGFKDLTRLNRLQSLSNQCSLINFGSRHLDRVRHC